METIDEDRCLPHSSRVFDVCKGMPTAHVSVDVNGPVVMASITNKAVDAFGIKVGMEPFPIIKASEPLIGIGD